MKLLCSTAKMKMLLRVILELLQLKIKDTNSVEVGMQNWRIYCMERLIVISLALAKFLSLGSMPGICLAFEKSV